ncbi:hypothetical protein [Coprococcus sp. AF21-14LB]|uniref:hypothetical protein n=1 Tax=Coprococcus sp. AF21-14LB TaxID=2292231 RepID=UPI0018F1BCC1|nr:hypothetical protein [Coprococcus sp. AF21-14LB]
MITMNEKDKNEMLDSILNEKEEYLCKRWGVLMVDSKTYAAIGGFSAIVGGGAAALGALSNAIGSDIQGQKENVERFCQMIQKVCKN